MKELQGLVVFYTNIYPDLGQSVEMTVKTVKEMNKPLVNKLIEEAGYLCLFVPTTKEASRVEKVDYDAPFPRCIAGTTEIEWQSLIVQKKKKYKFLGDENPAKDFQGIINLYVNFHPEVGVDHDKLIEVVRVLNEEVIKKMSEDGRYELMIVPTTKEATRMEKIDFDAPFPRFIPKSIRAKLVLLPTEDEEDEEETEEENEE